jgi:hypothetical protein
MKKSALIFSLLIVFAMASAWQFPHQDLKDSIPSGQDENTIICPENVMTIVQRSCFDCHSDASGNFMAKGKLNFSEWEGYSAVQRVSRLEKICEEITKHKMPKKKYLKKHPESALSDTDITAICEWTAAETKKLFGE